MDIISQRGKNTLEVGIYSYKKDTLFITGADNETGVTHKIPNTQLFIAPKKLDILQNATFPVPKDNNFIATHLGIVTNFDRFMTEQEFIDFLDNTVISVKIDSKDLEPLELFHYYIPQAKDALPKFGQFTSLPVPIEFDDQSNYEVNFVTFPSATLKDINLTNKATKFGAGIIDANDSPTAWLKVIFLGKLDRK